MATALTKYQRYSRRRRRRAARAGQRLDIQGLRMVAVLTVFANHLWHWPHGGFIGVDVFFVISGYLITNNLLRASEGPATASTFLTTFYWNRVRRIVPAATVVLILTCIAAAIIFQPFRAKEVGVDAFFAFAFLSNWWFAIRDTDYFAADGTVSPLQHYWSLSIEEQFYFVWPGVILLISLFVAKKAWSSVHRLRLAKYVMAGIVVLSLGWALYETSVAPAWAYFSTFARVWELGIGALLACFVGRLGLIPEKARPLMSWAGLALITVSIFLISSSSVGFPAPWALLPVAGSALVIAAGVNGEPKYQAFLRNPVSGYIGNISYSLYLVHWPIIIIVAEVMKGGLYYSLVVVASAFGIAIASYHFVEQPLRHANFSQFRAALRNSRKRHYQPQRTTAFASVGALALLVVALGLYSVRPDAYDQPTATPAPASPGVPVLSTVGPELGPLNTALREELIAALQATAWPSLDPTMEVAMSTAESPPEVHACNDVDPLDLQQCVWGSPSAPTRIVLVGDSVALSYGGPLRELALNSNGQIQVRVAAMGGCAFADFVMYIPDQSVVDSCPAKTRNAVELIKNTRPEVVVISNLYGSKRAVGSESSLTYQEWGDALRRMIERFRGSTQKVVLLSAPPADKNVKDCYGRRSSVPADCISQITDVWHAMARVERDTATATGATWIDSRPWFCDSGDRCPSFAGVTPTKRDAGHMSMAYGLKIYPVIGESLKAAGLI
ncbi:acyltransferase family protein [Mycolicibacterium frederiksbergense]|uniref:acyltransferase family protein n=1 Tax=Mycolicibacterium frederiksbergense TaxID=117567 RepID=UPI00265C5075|nr:acyltransferase family protein [Mycolicibacterium frederiksbergense]MDO0978179.1 acyltransferase family protein [Mycolicibacterium frederiksbergense]